MIRQVGQHMTDHNQSACHLDNQQRPARRLEKIPSKSQPIHTRSDSGLGWVALHCPLLRSDVGQVVTVLSATIMSLI